MSLIALFASPALAKDHQVPFNGSLELATTVDFQFPIVIVNGNGTGNATHLGNYTMTFQSQIFAPTGESVGTMVFTAANGDQVFATFAGGGTATSDPNFLALSEVATITGGTGRFVGATGTFTTQRLLNRTTFTSSGSFTGTISGGRKH